MDSSHSKPQHPPTKRRIAMLDRPTNSEPEPIRSSQEAHHHQVEHIPVSQHLHSLRMATNRSPWAGKHRMACHNSQHTAIPLAKVPRLRQAFSNPSMALQRAMRLPRLDILHL